ncbi:MAG: ATP-binding protein [Magnetospiraceae bacterium]
MTETRSLVGHVTSITGGLVRFRGGGSLSLGSIVMIDGPGSLVIGSVEMITSAMPDSDMTDVPINGEIELYGEFKGDDPVFRQGVSSYPMVGAPVVLATDEDLRKTYAPPILPGVPIGSLATRPEVPANVLVNRLLGKHFGIMGSTGTGKSCALSDMINKILDEHPQGHVIVTDPYGEYRTAFGDRALVLDGETLRLPYWMLTFNEISEIIINPDSGDIAAQVNVLREAVLEARREGAGDAISGYLTADTPIPYRLSSLRKIIERQMGKLEKADTSTRPYMKLLWAMDGILADRRYTFMFSNFLVKDTLAELVAQILRVPADDKPIIVLDLSAIPVEAVDVVVSVLGRFVLEFSLWNTEDETVPVLLVVEDAHRFAPKTDERTFNATKQLLLRLAREGRKYGVALGLISQRPSELAPDLMSQCGTLFAFRMSNEADLQVVRDALPQSSVGIQRALSALANREAVAVGDGVIVPSVVRFEDLPPEKQPRSGAVPFAAAWRETRGSVATVEKIVAKWRFQQ